ncbi:hypothetical protein ACFSQ7_29365 [Paenibacillus rhizoplanae]
MAKVQPKQTQRLVTARVLRSVAAAMLPFYRKIAGNRSYARQWTTAIVTADLDLMGSLLHSIPALADAENYGTNGIGYFISFPFSAAGCLLYQWHDDSAGNRPVHLQYRRPPLHSAFHHPVVPRACG